MAPKDRGFPGGVPRFWFWALGGHSEEKRVDQGEGSTVNTRMLAWPSYMDLVVPRSRRPSRKALEDRPFMPFGMALRGPLPRTSSASYDSALLLSRKISGGRVSVLAWLGAPPRDFYGGEDRRESLPLEPRDPLQEEEDSSWSPQRWAAKIAYGRSFHFDSFPLTSHSFCA